jgi:ubiquinone/menaquinone biosynthesis C-methylase UbiE
MNKQVAQGAIVERESLERSTGELFGDLWAPYGDPLFEESVQLFFKRLSIAGFDLRWFQGKTCMDAGCGGGRNTIAMARLGAQEAIGIDLGEKGLGDARRRAEGLPNAQFQKASILEIPFESAKFDMVWCAGVLMITANEERALDELTRITKKGGYLYLLVYASGGVRWPLIQLLRPLAVEIGKPAIERAITLAGLAANKRRTFLDDLFCPRLDFYDWNRLNRMLSERGFTTIKRWGTEARLDHESDLNSYRNDLEALGALFMSGDCEEFKEKRSLFRAGFHAVKATIETVLYFEQAVASNKMTIDEAMANVIGQGHHRVVSVRG